MLSSERSLPRGVDHDSFQSDTSHEQTSAVDALRIDDEVVAELGADYRQRVEAVATINSDRSVHGKRDEVRALAAIDVGVWRLWILRINLDERTNRKGVIVLVTEHEQFGLIAVDGKVVIARAAKKRGAEADSIGKEAARDLRRFEIIFFGQTVIRIAAVPCRQENLTDLERIVAGVAECDDRSQRVIEHKCVIAVTAVNFDRAVDVTVVIDPLDHSTNYRNPIRIT